VARSGHPHRPRAPPGCRWASATRTPYPGFAGRVSSARESRPAETSAVDRRLGRRLSLYASSSHGEVVTPPHQKETQPARRDVIALTTGKQRTRGAGWLLSFVHSGHVVRARSRYCSYWRPTAEIKIGRGRHRVALKVSRDLAIDRALVSPGFVAMRVWPWCRGPVCSDKGGCGAVAVGRWRRRLLRRGRRRVGDPPRCPRRRSREPPGLP